MSLTVKVCGMTRADNIRAVEALGVDLMGFIFYPKSPRCLKEQPAYLPQRCRRVGVFVNETEENVLATAASYGLHYIQLHGSESPAYCQRLREQGLHLIKAFSVATADDLARTADYDGLCDYYLFDTKTTSYGGSGQQFDWSALEAYAGCTPFLLSGGLHPGSIADLQAFRHPRWAGIDLNSRFETAPGVKDVTLLSDFLKEVK